MTLSAVVDAIGIEPYFRDDAVVIYHADCRDILPLVPKDRIDLVLTDPPYGINYSPGAGGAGWHKDGKTYVGDTLTQGDDKPFDPEPLLRFKRLILWGANHYADRLPASPTWLVWHKRWFNEPLTGTDFADCEMAWSNIGGPARVYRHEWNGLLRASERGEHHHPAQKPVALMKWSLERLAPDAQTILDPFMGSGTTLRAAKDLGRYAIGIEIEEKYCEIAAKRMGQAVMAL